MSGFLDGPRLNKNVAKGLKDNPDSVIELGDDISQEQLSRISPVVGYVKNKFEEARASRRSLDYTWLDCYRNFRGVVDTNTTYITSEVSKAFIKITKTKTLAAYGQLLEVLFAQKTIPIEIIPSDEPIGIEEAVHIDPEDPTGKAPTPDETAPNAEAIGSYGDGNDPKPGDTLITRGLDWIKKKFGESVNIKPGSGDSPDRITFHPAQEAANKMNKRIHRQFDSMKFGTSMRQGLYEACMLGTGIIKGPFNRMVEYPDWDKDGNYIPNTEEQPILKHVSVWNWYPDPRATNFEQLTYCIERHKYSKSQMRDLKRGRSFRKSAIDEVINNGKADYVNEYFEDVFDENAQKIQMTRYEVLEYWGTIDKQIIEEAGIDLGFNIPDSVEELPCNIWICNNEVLRFVMNPLVPVRLPYYLFPYEFNAYSVFGVGVAENMMDTQMLMNGFMRLAVDNAVLSGSVMLEVDESVLAPGQDYKVETGKVFRKTSGAPNQRGVQSIQIQNTSQQNIQMFDTARRLADEATGIPSFSHGMTGVQGIGRTAGGINELMEAASSSTKTVIKNVDDYWLEPIGQSMYYWNMQYKFDPTLRGDLAAIAKGTLNLIQKEVKAQKLTNFAQVGFANPALAPWINAKAWLNEFADALELDIGDLLNRPDEAKLQAQIMQAAGGIQQPSIPQGQPQQQPQAGSSPQQQAAGPMNGQQPQQQPQTPAPTNPSSGVGT